MARVRQIDVLRGLAVVLVLGRHLPRLRSDAHPAATAVVEAVQRFGWVGVDLFFVLSGFLVSGLLFREWQQHGDVRIGRFLVRRGLKIYPSFYALLATTVLFQACVGAPLGGKQIAREALFITNYAPGFWDHTWSLAVEEHFYFLLAMALALLAWRRARDPFAVIWRAFLAVAALTLALRVLTVALAPPYRYHHHLFPTHLRIDGLYFGVVLSYWMHFHRGRLLAFVSAHTRLLVACAVAGIAPAAVLTLERSFFLETFGLTGLYLGFGALLLLCLDRTALRGRLGTAFAFVGVNSYSIYLWHLPVKRWVLPKLEAQGVHWPNQVAVYLVGSIVLGVVAAKVVEFPMLALRDRLFPSRSDPEREKSSAA